MTIQQAVKKATVAFGKVINHISCGERERERESEREKEKQGNKVTDKRSSFKTTGILRLHLIPKRFLAYTVKIRPGKVSHKLQPTFLKLRLEPTLLLPA